MFWDQSLAELLSKGPERLLLSTDGDRHRVPQPNNKQSSGNPTEEGEEGTGTEKPEGSETLKEHDPQKQLTGTLMWLTEIRKPVGVWPRSSACMIWLSNLMFFWDS